MSVARLAARLRAGELSPTEAVHHYLDRIERLDPQLNAFVTVRAEEVLAEASALERSRGERGSLYGVPLAVKDVIDVAGTRTTAGSRVLADHVPAGDAAAVARLRAAGALILGKLNTHEFAYGAMTTSPYPGPARNPWAPERICGGSSGGSGAAAAAGLAAGTLGTDTAGSIRIPASFCGVTGLRPTTGRVSTRGVVPVSWSFDAVGPIARTAEDCALLLQVMAGREPGDPSTVAVPVPEYRPALGGGLAGLTIGVVSELFEKGVDAGVARVATEAVDALAAAGARCLPVDLPLLSRLGTIQQAMQFVEATSAHLGWLRTRLADYGDDVRARLLTGLFLPPTAYVLGQRARRVAYAHFAELMTRVDLLVAPTMPVLPPRLGEELVTLDRQSITYRLSLIPFNSPWSCVGAPVASVPCGFLDGLPVGLAIVGPRFGEELVLRAAHGFQQETGWHERHPEPAAATVEG